MHLVLVLVGAVLAFAGALLVLYAVPVIDVAAAALFSSGMFAIVGALIVFALAAVARGIDRIAERLEVQPLAAPAIPPIATVAHEEPPPRPARAEPSPVAAPPAAPASPAPPAERGPSVLSAWLKRQASRVQAPPPPPEPAAPAAPPSEALPRLVDEPRTPMPPPAVPDLDEPPAAPPVAEAPPPPPPLAPPLPPPVPPTASVAAPIPRAVSPAARPVPRAPAPATPPEATVYKSGVIDGMAYTLFMDGSIEAELPQGRVRFASVDELQRYLTNRQ